MNERKEGRVYVRVSTDEQVKDGVSLEQQLKDIERYCEYHNINIVKVYNDDGYSGADLNRPNFNLLLSEIKPGELFIVWDLSRYSRVTWYAIKTAEDLFEKKIYLVSLKEKIDLSTAMGKCMFTMTVAFFALERDKIKERTKAALQHLSKEGKLRSKAPYGYKFVGWDKDMEPVPEQLEVIKIIIDSYNSGMNCSKIANYLNTTNFYSQTLNLNKNKPLENPRFYPETVKRILQSYGLIESDAKPVDQRIVSFHKES